MSAVSFNGSDWRAQLPPLWGTFPAYVVLPNAIAFFILLAWVRWRRVAFERLVPRFPRPGELWRTCGIGAALVCFSVGTSILTYYLLSGLPRGDRFLVVRRSSAPLRRPFAIPGSLRVGTGWPSDRNARYRGNGFPRVDFLSVVPQVRPPLGCNLELSGFALLHRNVIGAFAFGVVVSLAYNECKNLAIPFVIHCTHNLLSSLVSLLIISPGATSEAEYLARYLSLWPVSLVALVPAGAWLSWYVRRKWPRATAASEHDS